MTIQIPTSFPAMARISYASGEPIVDYTVSDIAEATHLVFAHAGFTNPIQVFDPFWRTTSLSYTRTNDAVGVIDYAEHLTLWPGNTPPRKIVTSDVINIGIAVTAALLSCELEIDIFGATGAVKTLTATNTTGLWTYETDVVYYTPAQLENAANGNRLDFITGDIGARVPGGAALATGYLAKFAVYDVIAVATQIPRGR
jgi:hypothetical protein